MDWNPDGTLREVDEKGRVESLEMGFLAKNAVKVQPCDGGIRYQESYM